MKKRNTANVVKEVARIFIKANDPMGETRTDNQVGSFGLRNYLHGIDAEPSDDEEFIEKFLDGWAEACRNKINYPPLRLDHLVKTEIIGDIHREKTKHNQTH